jgi:hypothetical protein
MIASLEQQPAAQLLDPLDPVAEYRMFLVDASNSMGERLGGVPKISIVKRGLLKFYLESWPTFYPEWPLKLGVTAFNLKGVIGKTVIRELIPIMVSPTRDELGSLHELKAEGGSPVSAALAYAFVTMKSINEIDRWNRTPKKIMLIGDGGNKGPDPTPICRKIAEAGIGLDCIELSDSPSPMMSMIAQEGKGKHYAVNSLEDFTGALAGPG